MQGSEIVAHDGEVVEKVPTALIPIATDTAMAGALVRAEIDTQIATARQFPRSLKRTIDNILTLATLDEDTAVECIYALKRGGKPVRGPSIRLAEIIATQWGNNRSGAQVIAIDRTNKLITAEGFFHDLESNSATKATVQRRISDKNGKLFSEDMIAVTGNAACSIAKRNAVLAGVPKGVWRQAVEAAEQVIRGDTKTLVERRDGAIRALAHFNLAPEQIFAILDVKGIDDIGLDELVTLRTIYVHLKSGEQTVEELLRGTKFATPQHNVVANPLKDDPAEAAKTQTSDAGAAGDKQAATKAPAEPDAGEANEILAARAKGTVARQSGSPRKNMPAEYREKGREAEKAAWLEGYDAQSEG